MSRHENAGKHLCSQEVSVQINPGQGYSQSGDYYDIDQKEVSSHELIVQEAYEAVGHHNR